MISNLSTSQNGQDTGYLIVFGTAIRPKNYNTLQVLQEVEKEEANITG